MSDAIAEIEGLLEVNRDFCKKQMAEKASPALPTNCAVVPIDSKKTGSSRKVRETNREEPNEHKEETVISVAISKALGNFNLVIESLKFTC